VESAAVGVRILPRHRGHDFRRRRTTILTGVVVAVTSTFVPLSELAELVKIGTLFAFVLVAVGVLVLRRTPSGSEASLRCPGVPVVPVLAVLYLMLNPSRRDVGPVLRVDGPCPRVLLRTAQPTSDGPELLPRSRDGSRGEAQA
jgi:amino acid transporter